MENKIYNKYGALRHDTPEANDLDKLQDRIDFAIVNYLRTFPDLTPCELRFVLSYLNLSNIIACEVLSKAIKMKRAEEKG
jgi:hypothetical protein